MWVKKKGKGFPILDTEPGADPGVQAVSPQATVSHPPGGRLPLLSARPAVTSPAAEHHRPVAGTKLYCLVTETHRCEQLAQGCYAALPRVGFEPATYWSQVQRSTRCTTAPPPWRKHEIWIWNVIWFFITMQVLSTKCGCCKLFIMNVRLCLQQLTVTVADEDDTYIRLSLSVVL